jgi:hypothetical protein
MSSKVTGERQGRWVRNDGPCWLVRLSASSATVDRIVQRECSGLPERPSPTLRMQISLSCGQVGFAKVLLEGQTSGPLMPVQDHPSPVVRARSNRV